MVAERTTSVEQWLDEASSRRLANEHAEHDLAQRGYEALFRTAGSLPKLNLRNDAELHWPSGFRSEDVNFVVVSGGIHKELGELKKFLPRRGPSIYELAVYDVEDIDLDGGSHRKAAHILLQRARSYLDGRLFIHASQDTDRFSKFITQSVYLEYPTVIQFKNGMSRLPREFSSPFNELNPSLVSELELLQFANTLTLLYSRELKAD